MDFDLIMENMNMPIIIKILYFNILIIWYRNGIFEINEIKYKKNEKAK
jgi:hypothetical protein